jgi:hypothetical protein
MTDEVIDGAVETPSEELRDARKEASKFGWTDKDNWVAGGKDEAAWVDADVFLARGKDYNGFLRKQNEALQSQIEELRDTMEAFKEHHNKVAETAYKKALKEVKDARKQALKEGNLELVAELEDHLEKVEAEAPQPVGAREGTTKTTPEQDRIFLRWADANKDWYNTRAGRAMADAVGRELTGRYFGQDFLDRVREGVKEELPHLFDNPARRTASAVDSGSTRSAASTKGKSFSDLPEDAKKACDKFVKQGLFKDRAEYVKEYFEAETEAEEE